MTPEEAWTGKKIDLSFLKVFGCKAYLHVPDAKRKKLDPKSKQLAHVGYCDETKGYRLLDPITGELHKGRDVVFFENKLCGSKKKAPTEQAVPLTDFAIPLEDSREMSRVDEAVNASEQEESTPDESEACVSGTREVAHNDDEWESPEEGTVTGIHQEETEENETSDSGRRYPLRDRKARLFPDCVTYKATHNATGDPLTVEEALSRPDSEKWKVAIEEELSALKKNKTWILTKRPQSCNVVDSKWLFRIKEEGGNTKRYKARLVARGFSQRYGEDYDETYSPVVRHSSLRLLLALAAKSNLNVDQMDVKTAFLNGELKETVYMKQPEGFEEMGDDYVCLLKRSLYQGLYNRNFFG
ncbi:hypothetical protein O0L34_g18204 [Tuta absoluta]|nr:hypothetical protein O0L34_g18204 [Tuta absoluta]